MDIQPKRSIKNAQLTWNEQGEPSSSLFDDIYFSTTNGFAESLYVFVEQNNLYKRWLACEDTFYVIGETGFGSGLNLLVTWQTFEQFREEHPTHILKRLHFISFEKYPLTPQDLINAHSRWPELGLQANQLQAQYPMAIAGCHRLSFDINHPQQSQLIVDLWIGDINDTITQLPCPPIGLVDTWYLDGFAPTKNPEMWHQGLYDNMAKLSKENASLATFTAAGDVRRGLQKSGYIIKKVSGFGKKREMITALFSRAQLTSNLSPWFFRPTIELAKQPVITIIGGGIASLSLALALSKRQIRCRILCQDSAIAQGASGNRQGGFYPLINAQHDRLSQFYSQAFNYAVNFYQPFISDDKNAGQYCGVVQLAYNEKTQNAQQKIIHNERFNDDLVSAVNQHQASELSGVNITDSGLYFSKGGWLSPKVLSHAMLKQAEELNTIDIQYNTSIKQLSFQDNQWHLSGDNTPSIYADIVVLANGHGLSEFEQTQQLPLYATAGQVSHVASDYALSSLKTVLCYQGYLTPASNNLHCLGASFNRDVTGYEINNSEHQQNIDKLMNDVPELTNADALNQQISGGKVGVRMSVKDHLPMVGAVPNYELTKSCYHDLSKGKPDSSYDNSPVYPHLFMLGGLGSRGLCSAPLLAELLTCQFTQEPMPIPLTLLNQLNPNRYWIKQLKKHYVDI